MLEIPVAKVEDREVRVVGNDFDLFEAVFERRKEGISFDLALDQRQIEVGTKWKSLRVELGAAANEHFAGFGADIERFKPGNSHNARMRKATAADHNRFAMGQRPPDGLKRLASHDDGVASGDLFEPLKIFRQVPWDFVVATDDSIEGHGCDGFEALH